MPEPITITSALVFLSTAIAERARDKIVGATWDRLKNNFQTYVPKDNLELQRAAYRAYLQATLQSCAALLERKGISVDGWFRLGVLPEPMANAFRSLLSEAP